MTTDRKSMNTGEAERCAKDSFFGKVVYLSGAISDKDPDEVESYFGEYQTVLSFCGAKVLNPLHNGLPREAKWEEHMRADITMMMKADTVVLLPNWRESKGARVEAWLAMCIGIEVLDLSEKK